MQKIICVCGAGTMGYGIAQVFAVHGLKTILFDVNAAQLDFAKKAIVSNLEYLLGKGKITNAQAEKTKDNLTFTTNISECRADVIIEAIGENGSIKTSLYNQLTQVITPEAIIVSNTSSLSISTLQKKITHPERFAGMHFFNPAPLMKLVEVIRGEQTADEIIKALVAICNMLEKTPVICNDSPGFIVNRVARHYYLEAMHLAEHEHISLDDIDTVMQATGFKMGPFHLMDLIGIDINLSVTESLYRDFNFIKRFEPSAMQVNKVKEGQLGKKTGKGFYDYNS